MLVISLPRPVCLLSVSTRGVKNMKLNHALEGGTWWSRTFHTGFIVRVRWEYFFYPYHDPYVCCPYLEEEWRRWNWTMLWRVVRSGAGLSIWDLLSPWDEVISYTDTSWSFCSSMHTVCRSLLTKLLSEDGIPSSNWYEILSHPIDRTGFKDARFLVGSLTLELLELLHISLLLCLTWPLHRRRSLHWSLLLPLFCCLQHLCYQISLASELLELLHISLLLRLTWSLHRRRSLHWSLLLPLFCCPSAPMVSD